MGGIKIKPHGAHGLVCTREIQDIRTPKGITKQHHINTRIFAFQSIFSKAFQKKKSL